MKKKLIKFTAYVCTLTMLSGVAPMTYAQTISEAEETEVTGEVTEGNEAGEEKETAGEASDIIQSEETQQEDVQQPEAEKRDDYSDKSDGDNITEQNESIDKEESDKDESGQADTSQDEKEVTECSEPEKSEEIKEKDAQEEPAAPAGKEGTVSSKRKSFVLTAQRDSQISFSLEKTSFTYTGKPIKPAVKNVSAVVDGSSVTIPADQYSVVYDNNTDIGTDAKVIIYGKGTYEGYFGSADFSITPADLDKTCNLSLSKTSYAYTGKAFTPAVTALFNGSALKKGKDYTVSYYNNTKVGTATVTVKGKGSFQGTVTMKFTITKGIQKLKVSASPAKVKVNKTSRIKVKGSKGKLTYKSSKPSVATVSKKGVIKGKKTGKAVIMVTSAGTGKYKKASAKLKITVEGTELTKKNTKISLSRTSYTYNGKKKTPSVRKVTYKGKKLKKNRDYKVAYSKNKNAGKAVVKITGLNKYSGSVKRTFTIKKASNSVKATITKNSFDVKRSAYIDVERAIGDITFTSSNSKIASVADNGVVTGKKRGTCTITVTAAGDKNHKKAVKKITVTVGERKLTDSECKITLSKTKYVYDGTFRKPTVTVKYDGTKLKQDRDYTVSYYDNKNAGEAKVLVKGKGEYKENRTVLFTIEKATQTNFSIYLKDDHIPYKGSAKVTVTGYKGELSYDSYSPSYAKPVGNGVFMGLKKTQNYVTITVTASGDENYKSRTLEKRVHIY